VIYFGTNTLIKYAFPKHNSKITCAGTHILQSSKDLEAQTEEFAGGSEGGYDAKTKNMPAILLQCKLLIPNISSKLHKMI
jgi:hypothetical protein